MQLLRRTPRRGPQVREWRAETDGGNGRKDAQSSEAPQPQPERHEPRLRDPGLTDLSARDYVAALKRAMREALDDGITDLAAALAYYSFLAIPSVLLVVVGVFTLAASPQAITTLMDQFGRVMPAETTALIGDSLKRLNQNQSSSVVMTIVGSVLALWATTSATTAFMRALNTVYDRKETRSFLRQRIVALEMLGCMVVAFALVFGLLVLGPALSHWVGTALGAEGVVSWIWWVAQWPVLVLGLLAAFATLLYLGPNVDHPRWQFLTPGSLLAVVIWLLASGLFALYTSMFGSYNKAWGSLAGVIVMLTWLWLSGLALLLGAELNAELERSRELRRGEPAERTLTAP